MSTKPSRRIMPLLAGLGALILALAACGGSDDTTPAVDTNAEVEQPAENSAQSVDGAEVDADTGDTPDDNKVSSVDASLDEAGIEDNGRAFRASDDAVITSVETALKGSSARWDGDTLVIEFSEGSVENPTVWINCSAATTILAEDEPVHLVYPDGTLDCADDPRYN